MKFCKDDAELWRGPLHGRRSLRQPRHRPPACTVPCDPRGDGTMGCGGGLRCFLFDERDRQLRLPRSADKGDGEACQAVRDCQPGHLCVEMEDAARVCRPLCQLADGGGPAGRRTCARLVMPDYKIWGACLPP